MAETLGVVLIGTGVALVYAALTDQNPVTELRKALSTGATDGRPPARPFGVDSQSGATSGTTSVTPLVAPPAGTDPTNLVTFGKGNHRLIQQAAIAFNQWQAAFGAPIQISDSFRSQAQQAAAYASDPSRFAAPGTSAHGDGRAVDVDLGAIGAKPQGTTPSSWLSDPVYNRLVAAAARTGWCNYQVAKNSTGGKIAEPWHFSWGYCK